MLEEMPKVELRGEEYELEPLGINDLFQIKSLIEGLAEKIADELDTESINLMNLGKANQSTQLRVLSVAIDVAQDDLYNFLEMITGIDREKLEDKSVMPADAPIRILKKFYHEHPDIEEYKGFLTSLGQQKEKKKKPKED